MEFDSRVMYDDVQEKKMNRCEKEGERTGNDHLTFRYCWYLDQPRPVSFMTCNESNISTVWTININTA